MEQSLWDSEFLKSRGLIFGGRYLPYNPKLQDRAKEVRFTNWRVQNDFDIICKELEKLLKS